MPTLKLNQLSTIILFLALAMSCQTVKYPNFSQIDTSTKGMVSCGQPLATLAGKQMLEKGGNAVDAAVASAFALAVVEPSMNGIGGRMQAIVRLPNGEIQGIDGTTQAPMRYDTASSPPVRYGYGVIGIPGVVAGLTKLLEEHGSLPLKEVMKPAIKYAKKGFPLLKGEAKRQASAKELLQEFKGSQQYFLKDGRTYLEGEKWVQKDLGNTLELIAQKGRDAFYKGEIARKIVADFQANGGLLTMEDLANYEAKTSRVLHGTYRGHDIHGLWMPSFGAITIEIMNILEHLPMSDLQNADWASAVAQAIELAYQDRRKQRLPQTDSIINVLTSKSYAATLANKIAINGGTKTGYLRQDLPESWTAELGHTTHLSVADENGMMVALTQTIGPNMGSKVATPGLGFLYAVTLGRYLGVYKAGERSASHVSPMIITKDGEAFMALGAAGGSRIPTAIVATTSRVIDHKMPLQEALAAARVYHDGTLLHIENHEGSGWKQAYSEELINEGFEIKEVLDKARFGRVHAVLFDPIKKRWIGGADPDWEGAVSGEK